LADPAVQHGLDQQRAAEAKPAATPATAAEASPASATPQSYFEQRRAAIRAHLRGLVDAVPKLPAELDRAWIILTLEFQESGLIRILLLVAGFILLGFGARWLFVGAAGAPRQRISRLQLSTVGERLRAVVARFAFSLGQLVAFALGSVGAFLIFDWPPLLREIGL